MKAKDSISAIVLATLVFGQVANGQSPDSTLTRSRDSSGKTSPVSPASPRRYHVNYVTGSMIIAVGLGTDAFAVSRIKNKPGLTDAELQALNPDAVNSFDRWALHQDPSGYRNYSKLSDLIEPPLFIILPALLGLDKKIPKKEWMDILFMYLEGHTITFTFYNYSWLGPTAHDRFRPLTYYTQLPVADRKDGGNRNSFYSGHTASVAFTTFFVTKVYCDYHPDLGASKYLLYTAALIPPVIMGYFRVRSLAHFPTDDLVGLSLGAVIGVVLPAMHKANYKGVTLDLFSTPDATGVSLCWKLPVHRP
ncbi:MAG: phosphatase PAP2 family protein [Bacteroidota bacterium]|nr:phosphatase PAP2 family protein [Bacteroidota bacterium]MDP4218053.1 phosphatase PAP2 family protein [Bacteroidota bacterium]MDP4246850.1 phosphatase PAP2 family protein [Bacteroidota bacterium]MDP4254187.1 phosphatase PAP2 family protein [Bacteroidota bacterium]MDP4257627.1 phosphatase PAP2 family protein [Bacteroidota bacterium]